MNYLQLWASEAKRAHADARARFDPDTKYSAEELECAAARAHGNPWYCGAKWYHVFDHVAGFASSGSLSVGVRTMWEVR